MARTITSPIEDFSGTTYVGGLALAFKDGKAYKADSVGQATDDLLDADDLPEGAVSYLVGAGYGVGRSKIDPKKANPAEIQADARDFAEPTQVGTPLRDAAVDPHEDDFLAPANAGEANPHGPEVVSPEIHASEGTRPVKPGDVHVDDTDEQDVAETEHTEASTDGTPIADAETATTQAEEPIDSETEAPKGKALDEALEAADLPKTGTADEKRARLAEHQAEKGNG